MWVDTWVKALASSLWQVSMPFGTFFINVTGSFLLGCLTGLLATHIRLIPGAETFVITENLTLILGMGFLGGYTTFSTALLETLRASGKLATGVLTPRPTTCRNRCRRGRASPDRPHLGQAHSPPCPSSHTPVGI
nr:CrcB family protein [Rothia nasimurium]